MASGLQQKSSSLSKKTIILLLTVVFLIGIPVYISFLEVESSKKPFSPVTLVESLKLPDDENVIKRFAAYGYNLNEIKNGNDDVPNLFLKNLPRRLTVIKDIDVKKDLFISALLPPILKVNEYILYERARLLKIIDKIEVNGKASSSDLYWLRRKMIRYRMSEFNIEELNINIEELNKRMNIIPPSLAITQAAIETGWGSSRFAQQANALYGQWTWDDDDGMIPLEREEDENHSIKKFDNLISAVESYALNLNTHEAYEDFRHERARFNEPSDINVNSLLITLMYYSELGYEYIDNLGSIIRNNRLRQFDKAKLRKSSFQDVKLTPDP